MSRTWRRGVIRGPAPLPAAMPLVVKLGGSLLSRPGWAEAAAELLRDCRQPLVVVGGGGLVDALRAIDRASPRPAGLMHDLAIDAMTLSARLVAAAVGLPLVGEADTAGGVLDAAAWLAGSGVAPTLPAGWQVTSDSIAAVAACETGRGLLLAKSVPPPPAGEELGQLAAAGWVDAYFPTAAARLATIAWAAPRA